MPRPTRSLFALAGVALALASVGLAARGASAQNATAASCVDFDPASRASVEMSAVIVVGLIEESDDPGTVAVEPEAYLKGSAERPAFTLRRPEPPTVAVNQASSDECPLATLTPGSRVLLALGEWQDGLAWPTVWQVFVLTDGNAASQADPPLVLSESDLIHQITSVTGMLVVPAEKEPIFSIQGSNIAILVVALVVVFGIGLALMRVWHRIDPT